MRPPLGDRQFPEVLVERHEHAAFVVRPSEDLVFARILGPLASPDDVLGMLAAGDTVETILGGYPWLEQEDVLACIAYAHRIVAHERIEPLFVEAAS